MLLGMNLQNTENYKYYKCRSLLACDAGGTVYDTSIRCNDSDFNSNITHCMNKRHNETSQSEKIVYIMGKENKCKKKTKSLVDLTTHLDDDKFNDYELYSNINCELENESMQQVSNKDNSDKFCELDDHKYSFEYSKYYHVEKNNNSRDLLEQILDNNDNFINEEPENDIILDHLDNSTYSESADYTTKIDNSSIDKNFQNQEEFNFKLFSASPFNKFDSSHFNSIFKQDASEFEYNLFGKTEIDTNRKHIHKRKQIYNVKNDSYNELLCKDSDISNRSITFESKNKKRKLIHNKENRKDKSQYQKRNPFANLKMSSILKGNTKQAIKKNYCRKKKKGSVTSSNDANFGTNYCYDEEVLLYQRNSYQIECYYNSKGKLLEYSTNSKLNFEFADADYLDYVQPRERVIESDMDKLLSPTIDIEFSERFKPCKMKQLAKEKYEHLDYNGNQIDFQNIQECNNQKCLSPNELVERELFIKSAYAKKLGYENYFNTSNDSLINEILFDQTLSYEQIKLDLNFIKSLEIYSKQRHFLDKALKSVSCTLVESLNEFNRFGGFMEETGVNVKSNYAEKSSSVVVFNNDIVYCSEVEKYQNENLNLNLIEKQNNKKFNEISSKSYTNALSKSNILKFDVESNSDSVEKKYLNNMKSKSSNSLKIKIKRVNDENNEYIIDDVGRETVHKGNRKIITCTNTVKNEDRYECYDCFMKFRTKKLLKIHVSENHRGPYDLECEICHMKFRKSSAYKKHQPWCTKSKVHKCNICSKMYCYHASLVKHLKTHNSPKNIIQL